MNNDNTVIARSVQDPVAFGEIFHRYAAVIHRYAARRAGDAVADDVTSETFLIAFQHRARFDPAREDARPWLFGIATNLIHRHRIATARVLRAMEHAVCEPVITHDPDDALDAQLAVARLAKRIRRLNAGDRDCLLLFAWAELSYDEIAEALHIPVGTVKSRLNRARRLIRTTPEEGEYERADIAPKPA